MKERKINAPEICDDALESVSGGTDSKTTVCPWCGDEVVSVHPPLDWTEPVPSRQCIACNYVEW